MKISKYIFLFEVGNTEFYVYSTLSNALIELDEPSYRILNKARKDRADVPQNELDKELYNTLILKKFIVENDADSFLYYKAILETQRTDESQMHLTLAPTMDCCFQCHYCFEQYKEKNYMTNEVMDEIVKYLKTLKSKPEYRLTWFGGEPLMALDQMEQFYDKLMAEYKKPNTSDLITTGFHINEKAIAIMKKIEINQVQITLDGLRDTHNRIKFTSGCNDVFSKVLENVQLLLETSDIHVTFRCNLTKQNAKEYIELYHLLIERFRKYKKFGISPAFVMDRGGGNITEGEKSQLFTPDEEAKFVLNLHNKYGIHSPFLHYPSRFFNECAMRNVMSISFDPEGYAYKCWEVIGNKEYAIGKLNEDGHLTEINEKILNRHLFGADPLEDSVCSACKFLPICNGGCPIQRIENMFEGKRNNCCTYQKGHMEEFLKIHLSLKKAGFDNY